MTFLGGTFAFLGVDVDCSFCGFLVVFLLWFGGVRFARFLLDIAEYFLTTCGFMRQGVSHLGDDFLGTFVVDRLVIDTMLLGMVQGKTQEQGRINRCQYMMNSFRDFLGDSMVEGVV